MAGIAEGELAGIEVIAERIAALGEDDPALEAQRAEYVALGNTLGALGRAADGERAAVRALCGKQRRPLNEWFKSGDVDLGTMIDQAFLVEAGINLGTGALQTESRRIQDRAKVEEVLPLIQRPGVRYAVFSGDLSFGISTGPAYLQTGGSVSIMIPSETNVMEVNPQELEVDPDSVVAHYVAYQTALLRSAHEEREKRGGRQYLSEQTPVLCARVGRIMGQQEDLVQTEAVQDLIRAAQEPLRQYLDDMVPFLVTPGRFEADSSDTKYFLKVVEEARHLNRDKVDEVVRKLVETIATANMNGYTERMVNFVAAIKVRADGGSDRGNELEMISRHADAAKEVAESAREIQKQAQGSA